MRDQYKATNGETTVEQPLVVAAPKGPAFSDIVYLAKAAVQAKTGETVFNRGGYLLTRAPGGFYGRGTEAVYFYTELNQLPADRPVRISYHLAAPDGSAVDGEAEPLTPQSGRPTALTGQLRARDAARRPVHAHY